MRGRGNVRGQPLTWRRLAGPMSAGAVAVAIVAAAAETLAAVVAGQVAAGPTAWLVGLLACLLVGSSLLDTAGRTAFSGVVGRAEGRLRADLLHAASTSRCRRWRSWPSARCSTASTTTPVRPASCCGAPGGSSAAPCCARCWPGWSPGSRGGRPGSGSRWWVCSPWSWCASSPRIAADRKLAEEAAWSDHSAQLEEAIAGRDDVRSSLGQPHVVRQYVRLAQQVLLRVAATCSASTQVGLRTGLVVHAALAALAVSGAALVGAGRARTWPGWSRSGCWSRPSPASSTRSPTTCRRCRPAWARCSGSAGCCPPPGARRRRARTGRPGSGGVPTT